MLRFMNTSPFRYIGIIAAWILFIFSSSIQAQTPPQYNVLFIVSDDLNIRFPGYGFPIAQTPNLDRLANRGVLFSQAHCQFPLCNPSRTSLLSSRRPDSTHVFNNSTDPRVAMPGVQFMPEIFKQNGYKIFDYGKIFHGKFGDYLPWDRPAITPTNIVKTVTNPPAPILCPKNSPIKWKMTFTGDEAMTDGYQSRTIIQVLDQYKSQKFMMCAGFHLPHQVMEIPKRYADLYPASSIVLPPEITTTDATINNNRRQSIACYYAAITFVDAQLGILLDGLERYNLMDKTIIVFIGDHGFQLGEHRAWDKGEEMWDFATRAPLIISVPKSSAAGQKSPRVVEFIDIYPTLVDLCGLPNPGGLEGVSLRPLLNNPNTTWNRAGYCQSSTGRTVATERYRYSEQGAQKSLFDHATDPGEYKNLITYPAYASVLIQMQALLAARSNPH
jgi:iduronate 2-sulfatase